MIKKKPTTAEILQQLAAQVAELRGRIEAIEQQAQETKPSGGGWWRWITQ